MKRPKKKRPMAEYLYRSCRVAGAFGKPAKLSIIDLLMKRGPLSLSEISKSIHRSKGATCQHLSILKKLDIVRYETEKKRTKYWIKYPEEVKSIIDSIEVFVTRVVEGAGAKD
ncbi:hypothetical protein CH333_01820 [candidate division WOR-3 bacterium JGI_Cruoil_03_44_89]|uniref:HTH arsR-type domain-containing protein n=1 Tax=candidate division WOR-3 bacterium JGI_Cruoil_03_44_89 TaxID=1973748 RepID=A0A235BZB6_UNCW3|nr:MAG: hypothetical protein CH333_01820 [candidate division WOR-3 bacterium JGI_Cruoil_03_44_89]